MKKTSFKYSFIKKMKKVLLEIKEEILNSIRTVEDHKKEIFVSSDMHSKDVVDIAFDNMDGNNLEALSSVEKKRLDLTIQALFRISQNTYGKCLSCEGDISKERIEAIPYAPLCIDCQIKKERKNKR